jgi:uncharacterized protein with PIN domain
MLGRLCRWLRALGVDAEFVEPGGARGQQQHEQEQLRQQVQEAAVLQVGLRTRLGCVGSAQPTSYL